MLITPKIVTLYQISNLTINGTILSVNNGYDFSRVAKTFFEYVVRESLAALYQILFNKIKREIINIVTSVVVKIVKEKVKLFIESITSVYLTKVDGVKEKLDKANTSNPI
jgi:radical SAM superfamily enzyme